MNTNHLNLIFPQWQGGGPDLSTYYGTREFRSLYLDQVPATEIAVDTGAATAAGHTIFGYEPIAKQMRRAHDCVWQAAPDTLFTLGGGCDAAIPAAAYLNHKYNGDLTVLWFDSHGDLNTPASSPSGYFYGMPLRTLLGEGDAGMLAQIPVKLHPRQVVMLGVRDLDAEEQAYIHEHDIPAVSVEDAQRRMDGILALVRSKNHARLYIHIDLDVLEPAQFPYVPLPVPHGLAMEALQALLCALHENFEIVGLDLMEYNTTGEKRFPLFAEISKIGTSLSR